MVKTNSKPRKIMKVEKNKKIMEKFTEFLNSPISNHGNLMNLPISVINIKKHQSLLFYNF